MNPEEKLAWQGNVHVYNALSEFYLFRDMHSLSSLAQALLPTQYGERAKEIIELIHADDKKLRTEAEVAELKDNLSLRAGDYGSDEPKQLYVYYKNEGYQIEDLDPDHLGVELKFLALLGVDAIEKGDVKEAGVKELRFLNNGFLWLDVLQKKLETDERDFKLLKATLAFTQDYLSDHRHFITETIGQIQ